LYCQAAAGRQAASSALCHVTHYTAQRMCGYL
jgi:hypothetical protein